ncbi:MAG: 8-amino-7-oxononanoate synthase [Pseudomonadota bacterium]
MIEHYAQQLRALKESDSLRQRKSVASPCGPIIEVEGRTLLSFCSNDYLGLANHPALIQAAQEGAERYGVGAGASHLVSGHSIAHEALEAALAAFMRLPAALFFSTGYMANIGIIPALVGRHDVIISDKLNHACLVDGALLSRAEHIRIPHADLNALEDALKKSRAKRKLVATDAVFSMDGDIAPLPQMVALCEKHGALLLIDDAHGFGVLGEGGRGSLSHFGIKSDCVLVMGTLGKAAGVSGAFVAGHATLIAYLMQRARTAIFTTATPPLLAHTLLSALPLIEAAEDRRAHLRALIEAFRSALSGSAYQLADSPTPIQPIIVGENSAALALQQALDEKGLWVPAIRPPTVPSGQARLRVSLSAAHRFEHLEQLTTALLELA